MELMLDAAVGWQAYGLSPEACIAGVEAGAERIVTPYPGGEIVWRCWGKGPPLALLHGGFGGWSHWIRNVGPLSAGYRVLVPDMPGFGDSGEPPQPLSAESMADAVGSGLRELCGTAPVAIAGFSFGAIVGGVIAQRRAAAVKALVLVGAVGMGLRRKPMDLVNWRRKAEVQERRGAQRTNLGILMIADPARIDDLAVELQDRNTLGTRARSRPVARTAILRHALGETDAALAGIWGDRDATAAPYIEERRQLLQELRPGSPFVLIEDAGHWVQYEAADRFNAALTDVLETIFREEP
jgi:2-hydroxy-6-oxonona-2,4-dienedioate hydrolase